MQAYYITRSLIAIVFGGMICLLSGSLLAGLLSAAATLVVFIYLPRSGRYKVFPEKGATALRRDEWSKNVNQRSGLYAWVVVTLAGSVLVLYYGQISPGNIPLGLLGGMLLLGVLTYYLSDFWMRRL